MRETGGGRVGDRWEGRQMGQWGGQVSGMGVQVGDS